MEEIETVRKLINSLKGNISTNNKEIIHKCINKIENKLQNIVSKEKETEQQPSAWKRLEEKIDNIMVELQTQTQKKKTYSEIVQTASSDPLIITPTAPASHADSMTVLSSTINPQKLGLQIKSCRQKKGGAFEVNLYNKEDRNKLQNTIDKNLQRQFNTRVANRRNPHIMVHNIPKEITTEEVEQAINTLGKEKEKDTKYIFKTKNWNEDTYNAVISLSPATYQALINLGRVAVNWHSLPVRKFTPVLRCYRCQAHGHFADQCREEETCGRCAGQHATTDCTSRTACCALCSKSKIFNNKKHTHSAMATKHCPTLNHLITIIDNNTQYNA